MIVLLHDEVGAGAPADERDVYVQMGAIEGALDELGHAHLRLAFGLDLERVKRALGEARPDLVFNLVESVGGEGRLIHLAPALLDAMRLPYTGCPSGAVYATSNKLLAKRLLKGRGIATPGWFDRSDAEPAAAGPGRWIIKSVWEHASRGLDEDSVVSASCADELRSAVAKRLPALGHEGFAEAYIDGREFNLSVLDGLVLPPAEIVFEGYSAGKPKVVGYRAKWDESSYEYTHTPRRFDFSASDRPLLEELRHLAERCWSLFALRGYARVDFRVDDAGRPWVLEINTNPCLSPDAGFAAALQRAEIPYAAAIERIVHASLHGAAPTARPAAPPPHRPTAGVAFRDEPRETDLAAVRDIVASTGFFHDFEVEVAVELVQERLARGVASGYFFLFADDPATGRPLGYACFGPIGCTVGSYDLYWIAVHQGQRGRGLGRAIMDEAERRIRDGLPDPAGPAKTAQGRKVYAETSSTPKYAPTRRFYLASGYLEEARFADFYAPGDDKVVFVKTL
jgi:D-alanine-D-alanine ligase